MNRPNFFRRSAVGMEEPVEALASPLEIAGDDEADFSAREPEHYQPLSQRVVIRHLSHASRRDAQEKARGLAAQLFDAPASCRFYVQAFGDGFAIEVQDGVGRPYLPSIIASLKESPATSVAVPMSRRFLVIQLQGARGLTFSAEVLPEGMRPYPGSRVAQRTEVGMWPVVATNIEWLIAGRAVAGSGVTLLLAAMLWFAFDPKVVPPAAWRTTDFAQLAVLQEERRLTTGSDYLVRMEFKDGRWFYHRKPDPMLAAIGVSAPQAIMPAPPQAGLVAAAPNLAGTEQ